MQLFTYVYDDASRNIHNTYFYRSLCFHRCLSVHRGICFWSRGMVWQTAPGADTAWADTPPWADTPWADTPLGRHPPGRHPPGQTPLGRHPPRQTPPSADTPLGRHPSRRRHPPGRLSTSGRYAHHWNAFLCLILTQLPIKIIPINITKDVDQSNTV